MPDQTQIHYVGVDVSKLVYDLIVRGNSEQAVSFGSRLIYRAILHPQFSASSKAFFGPTFPSVGGFDGFLDFDAGFSLLAGGLRRVRRVVTVALVGLIMAMVCLIAEGPSTAATVGTRPEHCAWASRSVGVRP